MTRFAIVGTNFISDSFVEAARSVLGAEITAVYSRKHDTGAAFAEKHGINTVFTDYNEMLKSRSFDAVYVASPTLLHPEHAIAALLGGYHVLCEKMIATTLRDFYRMKDAAESSGRVLLEAHRTVHDPLIREVENALSRIGRVRRASLEFCQYSSRYDKFKAGILTNAFDPKMKNSALSDIGIYPLTLAVMLFGMPESIDARSVFLEGGFEGAGNAMLGYRDKLVSVIYSKIADSVTPSVIEGELGSVTIDKISAPTEITLKLRGKPPEVIAQAAVGNNMVYEIESFLEMCRGERDPHPYLSLTERTQLLVDEIYNNTGIPSHF